MKCSSDVRDGMRAMMTIIIALINKYVEINSVCSLLLCKSSILKFSRDFMAQIRYKY